jgi:death-on-curing protein
MKINFLDLDELIAIHSHQINTYGGLHGIRDHKLLESAINYPQAMFAQKYLHRDVYRMTAAYMYAITKNHPFLDGNKRTGMAASILFLERNDMVINATIDELFNLAITTAVSKNTEDDIALFFEQKSIKN